MSEGHSDQRSGYFVAYVVLCVLGGLTILVFCTPYLGFASALLIYSLSGGVLFLLFAAVAIARNLP